MTDARKSKLFFLRITKALVDNIPPKQETLTIKIPLENCIDEHNVGELLLPEIISNSNLTNTPTEELHEWFENYKTTFPLLFHKSDEINNYLELLRSPNQSEQINARNLIRIRYSEHKEEYTTNILDSKNGELFNEFENIVQVRNYSSSDKLPHELTKGIIEIFRNTNDRVAQHHILDVITLFQIKEAEAEIVKCIQRNLNSFEFYQTHVGMKYIFLDFLFDGLIQLKSKSVYPIIRGLIKHQTTYLLRPIIRFAKGLKIKKAKEDLISMMSFGIDSEGYDIIRKEACEALFQIGLSKSDLNKILNKYENDELYDSSTIYLFTLLEDNRFSESLSDIAKKGSTNSLKKSIIFYIKKFNLLVTHKDIIIDYFLDENQEISNAAHHIIHYDKEFLTENDKIEIALRLIEEGHKLKNEISLMKGLELMFTRHNSENIEILIDVFLDFLENRNGIIEEKMLRIFGLIASNYKSERLLESLSRHLDYVSTQVEIVIYINKYLPKIITFNILDQAFEKTHYLNSKGISEIFLERFKEQIPNYIKTKLSKYREFDFIYKAAELVEFPLKDLQVKQFFIQNLNRIVQNHYHQSNYKNDRVFLRFLFDKFPNESADLILKDLESNQIDNLESFNSKVRLLGKVSSENCKIALLKLLENQYLENHYGIIIPNLSAFKNDQAVVKRMKSLENHHNETIRNTVENFYK